MVESIGQYQHLKNGQHLTLNAAMPGLFHPLNADGTTTLGCCGLANVLTLNIWEDAEALGSL